uniref:Uncharacterized protein n=1 Tax=Renouxia sp. TaxID=2485823 RepID=A0A3G3MHQ2_9FLOR|nr:hypothetical protein [Renouxia sp.]
MEIINLTQKSLFVSQYQYVDSSFVIKIENLKQIWLFNCCEGCQHLLAQKKLKISQIAKIIITELTVRNVSGLLGLLSSLSLSTRISKLDIYGPRGLIQYIVSGCKYSQTSFHYVISVYKIKTGPVIVNNFCQLYAFSDKFSSLCFQYIIITSERAGRFNVYKAAGNRISLGPLYNKLKLGSTFILPDGSVMPGTKFIKNYYLGHKISLVFNYGKRQSCEIGEGSQFILYK